MLRALCRALALSGAGLALVGCSTAPRVSVADGTMYGPDALAAVNEPLKNEGLDFTSNLKRYFASRPSDYDKDKRRMDAMLDGQQRLAAYLQSIRVATALNIAVKFPGAAAPATTQPSGSGGTQAGTECDPIVPGTAPAAPTSKPSNTGDANGKSSDATADTSSSVSPLKGINDLLKSMLDDQAKLVPDDSPFDRLDRASDFYSLFFLKFLRTRFDKKDVVSPPSTQPVVNQTGLYLLYLPVQIQPGNEPNKMVGVRIKLLDQAGKKNDEVQILRLAPTRTYDIENVLYGEAATRGTSVAGSGSGPLSSVLTVEGSGKYEASVDAEARRSFLSRVPKIAAVVDAPHQTFGWDFYPTNLEVKQLTGLPGLFSWLAGSPREYKIEARLEAGMRDCAAYLYLHDKNTIKAKIYFVVMDMNGGKEKLYTLDNNGQAMPIDDPSKAAELPLNLVTVAAGNAGGAGFYTPFVHTRFK